jgi:hypothetical protein
MAAFADLFHRQRFFSVKPGAAFPFKTSEFKPDGP